jgi:Flp pilus assembly protein TadG
MLKREDSERGQVIVLFVIVFSIFLMLAAFAIDQGYWYGRRRVVQKDADLPARAGAAAYLGDIAGYSAAETLAVQTARDNGVAGPVTTIASDTCTGTNASGAPITIDAPSITVELTTQARRFLSGLPLISDDSGPVEVGARAVACVGRVARLHVGNGADVDDENRLKGIPIALRSDAPGPNTCFSGGALRLGFECVIYGTKAPPPGIPTNVWARRRVMFNQPSSAGTCTGNGSVVNSFDEIEDGLEFTCTVATSNSCSNSTCIRGEDINEDENSENVFDAMEDRLRNGDAQSDCAKPPEESPEQSFQNAFGHGNGDPGLAPDPPGLGGSAAPGHVYVQNDCYGNPRIVVMPIVSSSNTSERSEPVRGFATVYITGCYDVNQSVSADTKQRNECEGNWDVDNCDNPGSAEVHCFIEIRGVPIHQFIVEGSLGGISEPATSAPLTIQTVQ